MPVDAGLKKSHLKLPSWVKLVPYYTMLLLAANHPLVVYFTVLHYYLDHVN